MSIEQSARRLREVLRLDHEPVAVAFRSEPPDGVPRLEGRVPAGCSFWRRAEFEAFYTRVEDHADCPIGTLTMGFDIPAERRPAADQFFAHLCGVGYVSQEECARLPRVPSGHRVVVYSPLREARWPVDSVLSTGRALQAMLLYEAGRRLGMPEVETLTGRPTCGAIPRSMAASSITVSFGCIGARVYVGLAPEEMVFALPGRRLEEILGALEQASLVNHELEEFHARQKIARIST